MSLLHTLFRRAVTAQPQQPAHDKGPVVLQPHELKAVVGAGPHGHWLAQAPTTAGQDGTLY